MAIPTLAENVLDGDGLMRSGQYHYEAQLLPVLYLAFAGGVARLSTATAARVQLALLVLVVLGQPLHRFAGRGLLVDIEGDPARAEIDTIVAQIPPRVSVISPQNIQPHVSDRTVSAYFHAIGDLTGDYPPFEFAVLPAAIHPVPDMYEVVFAGTAYSLLRLRTDRTQRGIRGTLPLPTGPTGEE